jgi:hypothetical protein
MTKPTWYPLQNVEASSITVPHLEVAGDVAHVMRPEPQHRPASRVARLWS